MPTYKLTYFNVTGLAEAIRYLFHYGGVKFEDIRLTFDDWPKYKAEMPMGQVPVLEIDGKKYNQSRAISRYLAKKFNLYGSNEIEALEIDATIDSMEDMRQALGIYYWEKDAAIKEKFKQIAFEKYPVCLSKFEEQVKKNGGYFVGKKLSWADIQYAAYVDMLCAFTAKDINKDYPELKKLVEKVNALPNIKAYLEKRPKSIF
ncbi:glutathione S-transferase-like [Odontomachus brunneus]|uniref:glutathione S-transferase-like n=1 Tax=Odontomachus brunneus TaxID=486640 RepID=UPI0013F1B5C3|nr:glutathione S-transferase-like [Odontomachus brunneus]